MSPQADYVVANGTGAAVRSDINGQLAAIVSNNSGASAPATTYAYQFWADTSTNLLKLRNGANSAFITVGDLTAANLGLASLASPTFTGTVTIPTLTVSTGANIPLGTAASPTLYFTGDTNTGLYSPGADQLALTTGGTGRLFINSSGSVGIGTSSPSSLLHLSVATAASDGTKGVRISNPAGTTAIFECGSSNDSYVGTTSGSDFSIRTNNTPRIYVTNGGNVGIGTTSPSGVLEVQESSTGTSFGIITSTASAGGNAGIGFKTGGSNRWRIDTVGSAGSESLRFYSDSASAERARIDSSGRLLVGTSTARANLFNSTVSPQFQVEGTGVGDRIISVISSASAGSSGPSFAFGKQNSGTIGGNTAVASGDNVGNLFFQGNDGTEFVEAASISAFVDGTPGANDMPGRLVFSTTADGASSPTQRMVIKQNGTLGVGVDSPTFAYADNVGFQVNGSTSKGSGLFNVNDAPCLYVNRKTSDGDLVVFARDASQQGSISVSGTTVSLNGAHLSRWSQLPSGAEREEILRGSVLSNIDEMCEWGDEENEQLNRMKVSDVEGDKNVSGVFQCWDDDDDTYTNDFYCAMTGDFIIRIAEGVTVERGDLLMSAGDGTAKPQDDDIIRSKTIAKVTSTNVSCTYEDGSYCVPCVLMAC